MNWCESKLGDEYYFFQFKRFLGITTKSVNNKYISNVWLSHVYFRSLMQTMTGFYTNWQFMNINTFADRDDFALLWYRIYNRYKLGRLYTSRGTFFAWFVQLTYFKDPKFLIVFIKKVLRISSIFNVSASLYELEQEF